MSVAAWPGHGGGVRP